MASKETCCFSLEMLPLFIALCCCIFVNAERTVATTPFIVTLEADLFFEIVQPENLSYTYKVKPARDFGVDFHQMFQGIHLVPTTPQHACSPLNKNIVLENQVALVERGGCSFLSKSLHAEQAGAAAVIIMDNLVENIDSYIDMVEDGTGRTIHIPVLFLLGKNGFMIRETLEALQLPSAIINIPINITGTPIHRVKQPPWTIW